MKEKDTKTMMEALMIQSFIRVSVSLDGVTTVEPIFLPEPIAIPPTMKPFTDKAVIAPGTSQDFYHRPDSVLFTKE